jgi:hypothetical protein
MARTKLKPAEIAKRKREGAYHDGRLPLSAKRAAPQRRRPLSRAGAGPVSPDHRVRGALMAAAVRTKRQRTDDGAGQRGDLHARPNTASRQQTQSRQLAALG